MSKEKNSQEIKRLTNLFFKTYTVTKGLKTTINTPAENMNDDLNYCLLNA